MLLNSILKLLKTSVNCSQRPFGISFPYSRSFSFWEAFVIIFGETSLHVFPIRSIKSSLRAFYISWFRFCLISHITKYRYSNFSFFPLLIGLDLQKSPLIFFLILGFLILVILFLFWLIWSKFFLILKILNFGWFLTLKNFPRPPKSRGFTVW